ncbi:hypothetical protein GN956_G1006 [Arapaima gigas]
MLRTVMYLSQSAIAERTLEEMCRMGHLLEPIQRSPEIHPRLEMFSRCYSFWHLSLKSVQHTASFCNWTKTSIGLWR